MQELKNLTEKSEACTRIRFIFILQQHLQSFRNTKHRTEGNPGDSGKSSKAAKGRNCRNLIYEFFSEKGYEIKDEKLFMGKFGAFYPILLGMRDFTVWAKIKALAEANNMAGVFILRTLLEELFTLLGDCDKMESEFSKKFPKSLEKILKALKDLINETKAAWDKNRLQQIEKSFQWHDKQDTFQRPGTGKNSQENLLNGFEGEVDKNQDPQHGTMVRSEKLVAMTQDFMSSENAGDILDSAVGEKIAAKIEELIPILEDHLEMLEILSMLFPGKIWDHSLRALHSEYFGSLEKYSAMLQEKF